MTTTTNVRRYNCELNEELYGKLKELADREGRPVAELIRSFIKLGLIALQVRDDPDAALIVRKDGKERELVLL